VFVDYRDIFDRRGHDYHEAMQRFPFARAEEFTTALSFVTPKQDGRILDVPSGGSYVSQFLADGITLVPVETSAVFVSQSAEDVLMCSDLGELPVLDGAVDSAVSIAGVHHIEDREPFYRELMRVLRPGGVAVIADVASGSDVDGFLNVFVDHASSMGHNGMFLTEHDEILLKAAGFELLSNRDCQYHWRFESTDELAEFCTLLFGLDLADRQQVIDGVGNYVGFAQSADGVAMNWGLRFLHVRRPE
jgi:SAM-dependent methyltransferase